MPDRSGRRSALRGPPERILTAGQRGAICWVRCNNGKEVIQCLTSWWRVWLRRTRLWSRPPGSVDGAETSNHHEIRVRPPYVRFESAASSDAALFFADAILRAAGRSASLIDLGAASRARISSRSPGHASLPGADRKKAIRLMAVSVEVRCRLRSTAAYGRLVSLALEPLAQRLASPACRLEPLPGLTLGWLLVGPPAFSSRNRPSRRSWRLSWRKAWSTSLSRTKTCMLAVLPDSRMAAAGRARDLGASSRPGAQPAWGRGRRRGTRRGARRRA